jgi:hypothetical protein
LSHQNLFWCISILMTKMNKKTLCRTEKLHNNQMAESSVFQQCHSCIWN